MTKHARVLAGIALAAAFTFFDNGPAAAGPEPACINPKSMAEGFAALMPYACVELGKETSQGVTVRVLKDKKLSEDVAKNFTAAVQAATHYSLGIYHSLKPSVPLHNVSFALTDHINAGGAETQVGNDKECVIAIYTKSFKNGPYDDLDADARFVVAHEVAHCFQYWGWDAQMETFGHGGDWWIEGSADYLATLVYPEGKKFKLWTGKFGDAVGKKSMIWLTYENYVLFAWLAETKGVSAVLGFFDHMRKASGPNDFSSALPVVQIAAAKAALDEDGWQQFARDYVDGKIHGAHGEVIDKADLGEPLYINKDTDTLAVATLFTILRGQINFSGGVYDVTAEPSKEPGPQFSKEKAPWEKSMDAQIEASCTKSVTYRYAGFNTTVSGLRLAIKANKDKDSPSCSPCVDLGAQLQCMIGSWDMDNTALAAFLGKQLAKDGKVSSVTGDGTFQFDKGGKGKIVLNGVTIISKASGGKALIVVGADGYVQGKWSTKGAAMRFCPTSGTLPIKVKATIFVPQAITTQTVHQSELDPMDFTFICHSKSLHLESSGAQFHSGDHPQWEMTK